MLVRRCLLVSLLLALLLPVAALPALAQADCDPAVDYVAKAEMSLSSGNYRAAISAYDCAIAFAPEDNALRLNRGLAGLMLPDLPESAFDDIEQALNAEPELAEARLPGLEEAIAADPTNTYLRTARAYLLYWLVDDEAAMEDYNAILAADPNSVFALTFRGASARYLGDIETSDADFNRAAELAPDNVGLLSFIGAVLSDNGADAEAIAFYDRALAIDPRNGDVLAMRATSHLALDNVDAANADLRRALGLNPTSADLRENLGWRYLEQYDFASAIHMFGTALTYDPEAAFSYLGRGVAQTFEGHIRSGAQDFMAYVNVIEEAPVDATLDEGQATLEMTWGNVYRIPFTANAGDTIDISVNAVDVAVDSLILIIDPAGIPLIGNDDPTPDGFELNAALTDVTLPASGEYTLLVTHAGAGTEGPIEVMVTGLE